MKLEKGMVYIWRKLDTCGCELVIQIIEVTAGMIAAGKVLYGGCTHDGFRPGDIIREFCADPDNYPDGEEHEYFAVWI